MSDPRGPMGQLVGQTLGQYRIVEPLGQGGMSAVFKGYHPSLERYVAIKVLPPYFAHEPGFAERFTREARAVAQLDHPHILPVYDYGQEGDYSYIVLKYVPAGTLKDRIAAGPPSLEESVEIVCQIAEALDHAHGRGVIHRDVKPSNVLLDEGPWCLLTDFGLARMVEGSTQLTASGVGVGTPDYMAPEQGQGRTVDGRADVYSLGVVLYEMLTGQVPYDAETPMAVVLKHITEPLPRPRSLDPAIPEAVEGVILKALAKDADDRYATAGEMATALQIAVQATAEQAEPWPEVAPLPPVEPLQSADAAPPPPESPASTGRVAATPEAVVLSRRRRLPWWALALGALGVLVLASVALLATGVLRPFAPAPVPATVGRVPTPAVPADGVVVDNLDPGFAIEAGEWGTCEDGNCEGISYGADFRYADPGCTACRARFELRGASAGEVDLWTWWPQGGDRATDTPFTVQHGGERLTVRLNQRQNGSAWVRLATLTLGEGETVQVRVQGTETGYANADAVALTPAGAWRPVTTADRDPSVATVVDNRDPGFSIQAGEWEPNEDDEAHEGEFLYAAPGCTACRAQFEVTVAEGGAADLWAWWPQGEDRATDTPFTVQYSGVSLTINVDQRNNGTEWVRFATLAFEEGESVRITVGGSETGYANADAIALTPAGAWAP